MHIIIIITVYIDALITLTLTNIKERLALQLPSPLVKVDPRELDIHVPNDISLWLKQDDAIRLSQEINGENSRQPLISI